MTEGSHRQYFNKLSEAWKDTPEDTGRLHRYMTEFRIHPGDIVLDTGCGTGRLSRVISRILNGSGMVLSHDFAFSMISSAKSRSPDSTIHPVCNDIHYLCLKKECIDKIVCYSAFPHFTDQQRALYQMYYALKPGGRLLIFHTSSCEEVNTFHRNLNSVVSEDILPDIESGQDLLRKAGFSIVKAEEEPSKYWLEAVKPRAFPRDVP